MGPSPFWVKWLEAATWVVIVFGGVLVLAPASSRVGFSLLLYAQGGRIDAFGAEALRYIALAHAVLGSVMMGWGTALFLAARGPFARGERAARNLIAVSAVAWFVPDTAFSLWAGFAPNAALNAGLAALFAIPLAATWRRFRAPGR